MNGDQQLEQFLARITEGLSPLEKALMIAEAFRHACGGEWVIEIKSDEHYVVRRPA